MKKIPLAYKNSSNEKYATFSRTYFTKIACGTRPSPVATAKTVVFGKSRSFRNRLEGGQSNYST
jgi:hypothetical protein